MPVNSKAWLSKYIPLLRSATHTDLHSVSESSEKSLPDVTAQINQLPLQVPDEQTPLSNHYNAKEESFDVSEIEHWQDLDGQVYDWEHESDDEPEDSFEYTSLDYVEEIKNEPCWETYCSCTSKHSAPERKEKWNKFWRMFKQRTSYYIPVVNWLPKYKPKELLINDLLAGLTLASVVIPQGIAYSSLANVPPVYGLYTSWLPCILYFFFGTSRQLSIGPEGVISLLTGAAVTIGYEEVETTVALYDYTLPRAALLSFLVGIFCFFLGIFRVGFLDNLISRPILHGFVSASAAIIFVGQIDSFLGFSVSQVEWKKIIGVVQNIDETNIPSLTISSCSIATILLIDFIKKQYGGKVKLLKYVPTSLIVVVTAILITWSFKLDEYGVRILGDVQRGLIKPTVPRFWDPTLLREMLIEAILISIVGFVESNAIAKIYALEHNYEVSSNRELIALANSNIIASFFGSYPAFGSLSRSKIGNSTGASTQISGVVSAVVVLLTILFLMPLFKYLPKSAIAAIVMVAAARLIEFHLDLLIKIRAYLEICLTFFTFLATFFLGAELGIVLAIAISIFLVVKHTTLPNVEILGRTITGKWKDLSVLEADAQIYPGILVIRIDESLYFGNVEQLVKMINRIITLGRLDAHPTDPSELTEEISGLVIDARNIHTIDANAITVLKDMFVSYKKRNIQIYFANLKAVHQRKFIRSGLADILGTKPFFHSIEAAVSVLDKRRENRMNNRNLLSDTEPNLAALSKMNSPAPV